MLFLRAARSRILIHALRPRQFATIYMMQQCVSSEQIHNQGLSTVSGLPIHPLLFLPRDVLSFAALLMPAHLDVRALRLRFAFSPESSPILRVMTILHLLTMISLFSFFSCPQSCLHALD